MQREDVLERIKPAIVTQVKEIDHNPRTKFNVGADAVTFRPGGGQRTLEVTEDGVRSLANFVGLPWNLAANLHPATFSAAATDLLEAKQRYALVVKDQRIDAIVKRRPFHPINTERCLRTLETAIPDLEYHGAMVLDGLVVVIDVVGPRREAVSQGDLVQAGASIAFSPMGNVDPYIQSFGLRLECLNGQTSAIISRKFEWGSSGGSASGGGSDRGEDKDNVWGWFKRSTRQAYNAFGDVIRRYQELLAEVIEPGDRAALLENLMREAKLSGEVAQAIRARALERPPQNSYDMVNLLTYASSHLLEEPRQVIRARDAASKYVAEDTHTRMCPVCHTRRN